eukprot:jgi/Chlat1/4051/Chrsp26S04105
MKRSYRKSRATTEEEDGVEDAVDVRTVIAETRAGAAAVPVGRLVDDQEENPDEDGVALQDTFAMETEQTTEDPHMKKFIEDELRKRRGELGLANAPEEKPLTEEDELYVVPEHLKINKKQKEQGGMEAWATGIVEVPLGVNFKLANIEATEDAKRKLLDQKKQPRPAAPQSKPLHPASFSANFNQHGKDHAKKLREDREKEERKRKATEDDESPKQKQKDPYRGHNTATDDAVAKRFRARELARIQRR